MRVPESSKTVGLVLDPRFEDHDTGPIHAERPERLSSLRRALAGAGVDARCERQPLVRAESDLLLRVHDESYVRRVERTCSEGQQVLDSMDTAVCPTSEGIARVAAGSLTAMTRAVVRGKLDRGFAAVRPPGHHAESDLAMGFCLYNNVAVAARELIVAERLSRVMIVDWDVHHGNGTQHIFEASPDVFYFSVHQRPLYPGTGSRDEIGRDEGRGTTLNCPIPPGSGDDAFLGTLREDLVSAAERFRPEMVLLSAGFDAHARDPLAELEVSTEAYAEGTRIVCDLARQWAGGRLVSVLEGGYDLEALGDSVVAHLQTLLEHV